MRVSFCFTFGEGLLLLLLLLALSLSLSLSLSLISLTFTKDNWEKPLLILEKMIFPPLYINLEKSKINKDKTGEGTPRILLICHPLHFCKIYLV